MAKQDYSETDSTAARQAVRELHKPEMTNEQRVELDRLFSAAYDELRRLAISSRRSYVNPAVSTGTLVNEAWIRLARGGRFKSESRQHFMNIAGKVMRHILVEALRRKNTLKRGDGVLSTNVSFDPDSISITCDRDLLALDAALDELEVIDPRKARIVEERFFGGFEMAEIAERLQISLPTATREWRVAKARLAVAVHRQS